jgi:hypothetical protein
MIPRHANARARTNTHAHRVPVQRQQHRRRRHVVPQEAEKLHLPPPGSLLLSLSHAFSRSLVLSLARLLCLSLSVTLPCLHEFHFYSCICCPKKLKNRASLHRGRSIHRPSLDFSIAVSHSLYAMRLPLKGSGIYLPLSLGDSGSLSVLPSVRPSICPSVMLPHTQNTHARKHARARARTQGPTAFFHRFSATIYIYIYIRTPVLAHRLQGPQDGIPLPPLGRPGPVLL